MLKLVEAIRSDSKVGRGSCSSIDECWSDEDIKESLTEFDCSTIEEAIKWAYETEGLRLEQALNCRWGEDDDPQLKAYRDWHDS